MTYRWGLRDLNSSVKEGQLGSTNYCVQNVTWYIFSSRSLRHIYEDKIIQHHLLSPTIEEFTSTLRLSRLPPAIPSSTVFFISAVVLVVVVVFSITFKSTTMLPRVILLTWTLITDVRPDEWKIWSIFCSILVAISTKAFVVLLAYAAMKVFLNLIPFI